LEFFFANPPGEYSSSVGNPRLSVIKHINIKIYQYIINILIYINMYYQYSIMLLY